MANVKIELIRVDEDKDPCVVTVPTVNEFSRDSNRASAHHYEDHLWFSTRIAGTDRLRAFL